MYYIIYYIVAILLYYLVNNNNNNINIFKNYKKYITDKSYSLYKIIKLNMNYKPLIEPSVKIINNSIIYDRFSIPIFDIFYNKINITNIINTIITKQNSVIKILNFIFNENNTKADLIIGIDGNKNCYKFYIDHGTFILCLIYDFNNYNFTNKKYVKIDDLDNKLYELLNNNLIDINIVINNYNVYINNKIILDIINNNISHIYFVKEFNEYHIILLNHYNNIYVIGVKDNNEYNFYFR